MFVYLASEDAEKSSRVLVDPIPGGRPGQVIAVPSCGKPLRDASQYRR